MKDMTSSSDGLPAPLLQKKLHDAASLTDQAALDLTEGHLDISTVAALLKTLDMLAYQAVVAQACIISAAAALSSADAKAVQRLPVSTVPSYMPQSGRALVSHIPYSTSYHVIRMEARERLGKIGSIFDSLTPAFQEYAFPSTPCVRAWGQRPVDVGTLVAPRTGKGYLNTFKDDRLCEPGARQQAFNERLRRFEAAGGSLSDIIELVPIPMDEAPNPVMPDNCASQSDCQARTVSRSKGGPNREAWSSLGPGMWYDYVVTLDHVIRCYPTSAQARGSRPKCGHSLLACNGPAFNDNAILMAGDLCMLKDPNGNAEVLIVTNNSGHFKPSAPDLHNIVIAFEKSGIKKSMICLYSGPNSILALRRDLAAVQDVVDESPVPANLIVGEDPLNPYSMVSQWEKQR